MAIGSREIRYRDRVTLIDWELIGVSSGRFAVWTFDDAAIRLGFNSFLSLGWTLGRRMW